jgi:hypothetical protein
MERSAGERGPGEVARLGLERPAVPPGAAIILAIDIGGTRGCFERMCCGLWLERDYGKPAKELIKDAEIDVVPAALGDDSVLYGALALAIGCHS